jgi:hypothetical protein
VGLTEGVTGRQVMLTPPRHLILPSHYTRFCNCLLDYGYVLHIVTFAVLYKRRCKMLILRKIVEIPVTFNYLIVGSQDLQNKVLHMESVQRY